MFKIFVGNLNHSTTEDAIRRLFSRHAVVDDVAMPIDAETGKPRGFAIVMIKDEMRAKGAMIALRGTRLDGRALVINQARKKGEAPPKRERRPSSRLRARGRSGGRSFGHSGGRDFSSGGRSGGYGNRTDRDLGNRPDWRSGGGRSGPDDRGGPAPRPRKPDDDET